MFLIKHSSLHKEPSNKSNTIVCSEDGEMRLRFAFLSAALWPELVLRAWSFFPAEIVRRSFFRPPSKYQTILFLKTALVRSIVFNYEPCCIYEFALLSRYYLGGGAGGCDR